MLALDIGTSSVRAGMYSHQAEVFPNTMVKNSRQLTATPGGGFEIDAETAFSQVIEAIDELYLKCGEHLDKVVYGAISSFWHSIVGVDSDGIPTTKLFAWAETRPAAYVARLRNDLDASAVHNRTGCPFHSSYWPAKILWIKEENPEAFSKTEKWLSFTDFMGEKLFGSSDTSISIASGTGIFDIRQGVWDQELTEYLGLLPDQLPRVASDQVTYSLAPKNAERWPLIAGSKWFSPVGDGAANNIGAGCINENTAALMIGTSGALRVVYEGQPPPVIPDGLWCYRVDSKRLVIGGALSDGGGLYRWLKENIRIPADDGDLEREIASREPDGHGLTFLPFLAGERSTGYNDFATGSLIGLRTATDAVDIAQAAMESVAYRFAEIHERLCAVLDIRDIVASGGALRESHVWTQMICDVLGRDMTLPETREASSRGVVLLASEKAGLLSSIEEIEEPETTQFKCNPDRKEAYNKGRKRHMRYYRELVRR